jgi:ribokinase
MAGTIALHEVAMPDAIAVAGNLNADLVHELGRLPSPGETLLSRDLLLAPGGKAGNASVALARLGAAPRLIGCVGADLLGTLVLEALEREGVSTDHVVRSAEAMTGLATVLVLAGGENAIVTHLGANLELTSQALSSASGGWSAVLRGCRCLLVTLGLPQPVLLELVAEARRLRLTVVVDATPLRGEPPAELLAVEVLSANRVEAEQLIGRTTDPRDQADVTSACQELCGLGAQAAIVKLGAAGAAWAQGSKHGIVAAPTVRAVDTTGSGDAFMAGLTLRLAQGATLPVAIQFACLLGALSATGRGAQGGWTTAEDVECFAARALT